VVGGAGKRKREKILKNDILIFGLLANLHVLVLVQSLSNPRKRLQVGTKCETMRNSVACMIL
jgi:hypothetical protein